MKKSEKIGMLAVGLIVSGYVMVVKAVMESLKEADLSIEQELNDLETEDVNIDNSVVENSDDYHF